jgi:tetratricopeptide (TPR) repeat protein
MIANLLPGLREIRAPLVSGYLWLIFFFLLLHSELPSTSHPDSSFKPLVDLGDDMSTLGLVTVASVAAYLVGSAMQEVLKLLGRIPPWRPMYAGPGTHISQDGKASLRRTVRIQVERITRSLFQVALSPGERGIDAAPGPETVTRDLPLVRTLLLGQHPELVGELDRLQVEADLRITVAVPLGALAIFLAFDSAYGWIAGLIPAVMLLVQGYQRQHEAGDFLAGVLQMERVIAPAVKEFEVSVEAALERTDLERKLKTEMGEGDGMAAFRYANLLASSTEYEKAIEPLNIAVGEEVFQAYAELGFAWQQLGKPDKAERAYRDGAERGDLKARERLAELLHQLQRTEEALETESDEHEEEEEEEREQESAPQPEDRERAPLPRESDRIEHYRVRAAQGDAKGALNLGLLQARRGEMEDAIQSFKLAISLDPADPQPLVQLATAEIRRSQFTNARAALEQALQMQEASLGPDHLEVGLTVGTLGSVMSELGQDERALRLKERARDILEATLGAGSIDVAITKANIGRSLIDLGRYSEALPILEEAFQAEERLFGSENEKLAGALSNLGNARLFLGERRAALVANERALEMYEQVGAGPLVLAKVRTNLGFVRTAMGEYENALRLHGQALLVEEEEMGESAVGITDSLDGAGEAMNRLGRYADAVEVLERSWGIKEAQGASPYRIAQTLLLRAEALAGTGRSDLAISAGEDARTIFETSLGADSAPLTRASVIVGEALLAEGRVPRARARLKSAISSGEKVESGEDFFLPRALCAMARVMIRLEEFAEAEQFAKQAIETIERQFGPLFPELATALEVWADIREAKGEQQAAVVARQRANEIRESRSSKASPEDGPSTSG